jgi:hypothetical protein
MIIFIKRIVDIPVYLCEPLASKRSHEASRVSMIDDPPEVLRSGLRLYRLTLICSAEAYQSRLNV